jgi:hypothetical protein
MCSCGVHDNQKNKCNNETKSKISLDSTKLITKKVIILNNDFIKLIDSVISNYSLKLPIDRFVYGTIVFEQPNKIYVTITNSFSYINDDYIFNLIIGCYKQNNISFYLLNEFDNIINGGNIFSNNENALDTSLIYKYFYDKKYIYENNEASYLKNSFTIVNDSCFLNSTEFYIDTLVYIKNR